MQARIDGQLTEAIDTLLFNLIMDNIINTVKRSKIYKTENKEIKILCYANNALSTPGSDLPRLVHKLNVIAKKLNKTTQLTKTPVTSNAPTRCKIVEGTSIKQIMEINYLSVSLSNYEEHIRMETQSRI